MTDKEREVVEASVAYATAKRAMARSPVDPRSLRTNQGALWAARARWERAVYELSGVEPWDGRPAPDLAS